MTGFEKMPGTQVPGIDEAEGLEREKRRKKRVMALVIELNQESFPFPGIDSASYSKLKAVEEAFPGYATPIDTLIQRFATEGIKVVFGRDPENGDAFILPSGSDDIENDSVFPRQLQIDGNIDERLGELISLNKG